MNRERADHSLQATALVNEAYIRLVDYKRMQWQDRAHFFAVSAQLMRRILVERARLGGLSVEETAEVMKTSPRTVARDWNAAKAWLYRELRGASDGPNPV
jgi:predicted DNA-binding protein (UPF0251 family)